MQVANPEIESVISKLHYRVTSLIFLVSCLLVTAVEYIGNGINIACVQDGHPDMWPIPQHVMNTYCFIMGTFTLPRHFKGERGELYRPPSTTMKMSHGLNRSQIKTCDQSSIFIVMLKLNIYLLQLLS